MSSPRLGEPWLATAKRRHHTACFLHATPLCFRVHGMAANLLPYLSPVGAGAGVTRPPVIEPRRLVPNSFAVSSNSALAAASSVFKLVSAMSFWIPMEVSAVLFSVFRVDAAACAPVSAAVQALPRAVAMPGEAPKAVARPPGEATGSAGGAVGPSVSDTGASTTALWALLTTVLAICLPTPDITPFASWPQPWNSSPKTEVMLSIACSRLPPMPMPCVWFLRASLSSDPNCPLAFPRAFSSAPSAKSVPVPITLPRA
mmetsp:Transcript_45652/g.118080  ORF Transcript_45652/g.118080 Transcript_45652/m.118080 type:complete len:258 (-) Transcript_45652:459-1232(-)